MGEVEFALMKNPVRKFVSLSTIPWNACSGEWCEVEDEATVVWLNFDSDAREVCDQVVGRA